MADIFSLPEWTEGTRRFFVSRHLDSPLIADGLTDDRDGARLPYPPTKIAGHLRRVWTTVVERTDGRELCRYSLSACESSQQEKGCTRSHLRLVTPIELITLAETTSSAVVFSEVPHQTASLQADTLNKYFLSLNIPSKLSWDPSHESKEWLAKEDNAEAPQLRLVAERARGQTGTITARLSTVYSTHIALSDSYFCTYSTQTGHSIFGTYDMYLAWLDIIRVRARSFLASDVFYASPDLNRRITMQARWQRVWVAKLGSSGYDLAKQTEPLCLTSISDSVDPAFAKDGPHDAVWEKIRAKVKKLGWSDQGTAALVANQRSLYRRYTKEAPLTHLIELFGLQKLTSYPFIYAEAAGAEAFKIAKTPTWVSPSIAAEVRAAWCCMFIEGYLKKEHKWPPLVFAPESRGSLLHRYYTSGFTNLKGADIPLSDWRGVLFTKIFELDKLVNPLPLFNDKALSFRRDELDAYWDRNMTPSTSRRLLLEVMSRENFSMEDVIMMVENNLVADFQFIVSLYPKEKELKALARLFGMLTLEMRSTFACTEHNIAEQVFPYLSAQTMTRSKTAIQQIFYRLTECKETELLNHFLATIDYSRWNLRMRGSGVNYIAADLNAMFGTRRLFTFAHEFFQKSVHIIRTPRLRPTGIETMNPPPGPLVSYDHLSGIEGLAQKLWSCYTYGMDQRCFRGVDASIIHLGQADNQIFSSLQAHDPTKDREQEVRQQVTDLLTRIEHGSKEAGHDMNPDECTYSRKVMQYSKDMWVDGAQYFLSLKFASRIHARSADQIPSLVAELGGLHSAALAAAEANHTPVKVMLLAAFLSTRELIKRASVQHPEWDRVADSDRIAIACLSAEDHLRLLWWPTRLRGLPGSSIREYLYRGSADPLSADLGCLLRGMSVSPILSTLEPLLKGGMLWESDPDPVQLILDPYALPTRKAPSSQGVVKNFANEFLKTAIINPELSALASETMTEYKDSMLNFLVETRPFYPTVLREIVDQSALAELKRLEKMFVYTRTVQMASRAAGSDASSEIVLTSGEELWSLVEPLIQFRGLSRVRPLIPSDDHDMHTQLRELWAPKVGQVEGVDSYTPAYYRLEVARTPSRTSGVKLVAFLPQDSKTTRGKNQPYLGAQTHITKTREGFRVMGDTKPARALHALRTVRSLPGLDHNICNLIDQVAASRGPIGVEFSQLQGQSIGGAAAHRFHPQESERGSYTVSQGNLSTHCFFISDEWPPISGSLTDPKVMFQELYTSLLGYLGHFVEYAAHPTGYIELTLCIPGEELVPLPSLVINAPPPPLLPSLADSSLSKAIYDPDVWVLSLVGPLSHKTLVPEVQIVALHDSDRPLEALRGLFMQAIPPGVISASITDGNLQVGGNLKIDLVEALRLQGKRIVQAAAGVALIEASYHWLATLNARKEGGRFDVILSRLCRATGLKIMTLFEYPALLSDPLAVEIGLSGSPSYRTSQLPPIDLLSAIIRKTARRLARRALPAHRTVHIHADERGGITSHIVLSLIALCLIQGSTKGLAWSDLTYLCQSSALTEVYQIKAEGLKLSRLNRYANWLLRMPSLPSITRAGIIHLVNGQAVVKIDAGLSTEIRLARMIDVPVYPTSDQRALQVHYDSALLSAAPDTRHKFWEHLKCPAPVRRKLNWIWDHPSASIFAHHGPWTVVLSSIKAQNIMMVGVGIGVGVRAALECGSRSVIGVDDPTLYPLKATRSDIPPFEVTQGLVPSGFSWHPLLLTGVSDWNNPIHRAHILLGVPESTLVIVDIQPYPDLGVILTQIATSSFSHTYLLRRFCSYEDYLSTMNECKVHVQIKDIVAFQAGEDIQLFILCIKYSGWFVQNSERRKVLTWETYPLREFPSLTRSCRHLVQRALRHHLRALTGGEDDPKDLLGELITKRGLISHGIHRDSYTIWTKTLAQLWCLNWLVNTLGDTDSLLSVFIHSMVPLPASIGDTLLMDSSDILKNLILNHLIPAYTKIRLLK